MYVLLVAKFVGRSGHTDLVSGRERQVFVVDISRCSDFRTLCVHKDSYSVADRAHVVDNSLETFALNVCRVHAHHVQAVFRQLFYKVHVTTTIGDSCDNFRKFSLHLVLLGL